jgi:hypothetical protein
MNLSSTFLYILVSRMLPHLLVVLLVTVMHHGTIVFSYYYLDAVIKSFFVFSKVLNSNYHVITAML